MENQTSIRSGLEGRLEIAHITYPKGESHAIGWIDYKDGVRKVFVLGAARYRGKPCLVRFPFDIYYGGKSPFATFISSSIPKSFSGLGPDEYVLIGRWEREWPRSRHAPTLEQVNIHYSPGKMGHYLYLKPINTNIQQIFFRVNENGPTLFDVSMEDAVKYKLSDSSKYARVIIVEARENIPILANIIKSAGLVPIRMDPIKR